MTLLVVFCDIKDKDTSGKCSFIRSYIKDFVI